MMHYPFQPSLKQQNHLVEFSPIKYASFTYYELRGMLKGVVLTAKLDSVNQISIQPITESRLIMGYLLF